MEQLKSLHHEDFTLLACEAGHQRDRDRWATYPRDPVEAARAAGAALRSPVTIRVNNGLAEARDYLRIAELVLGQEEDPDRRNCAALAWLISRAE